MEEEEEDLYLREPHTLSTLQIIEFDKVKKVPIGFSQIYV